MPREGQPATPPGASVQRAPLPPATGSLEEPLPRPRPDATGREYHPHENFRPSTWWKALKNSWALTRWIVLVLAVGIGTAAVIAVLMAGLFTLVDSSL